MILCANFIIKYSAVQIIASIYLLIIVLNKFTFTSDSQSDVTQDLNNSKTSFLRITLLLALTDLAFSIDSVTAAVAISDQLLLVITGAIIGVVALRFTADYFIRWLKIFINLENAGYLAVALVAIKLIAEVVFNDYKSFEYCFYCLLVIVFFWGFSQKNSIDDIS
ncbi:Conserved membrane protein TerC [Prochlorococcus sp. MIT 0602]|nr:Conserved membrane protein TerC [Prochlorococcus sp. MIT 0602]